MSLARSGFPSRCAAANHPIVAGRQGSASRPTRLNESECVLKHFISRESLCRGSCAQRAVARLCGAARLLRDHCRPPVHQMWVGERVCSVRWAGANSARLRQIALQEVEELPQRSSEGVRVALCQVRGLYAGTKITVRFVVKP